MTDHRPRNASKEGDIIRKNRKLYKQLRIAIWDKGLTQREVAKMIGISDQLMSYYINGDRSIPDDIKRSIHVSVFPEYDFDKLFER